ncbi:MAG: DUF4145 domain-containing protein [Selenomonadaceae bacterium]|nr:DUF4145 domain-containing protein [Selenomonadaceae bacterium]
MNNFSFLNDKPEYRNFSKDCIDAENAFENSFNSCVKLVRSALEAAVKWVYSTDDKFSSANNNLFNLISNPSFELAVGKNLADKLHYCRKAGNAAIHNEKEFSAQEAITCLKNLFDFVQWLDSRYGENFTPRIFNAGKIPVKDPTWKKALEGIGEAGLNILFPLFPIVKFGVKKFLGR